MALEIEVLTLDELDHPLAVALQGALDSIWQGLTQEEREYLRHIGCTQPKVKSEDKTELERQRDLCKWDSEYHFEAWAKQLDDWAADVALRDRWRALALRRWPKCEAEDYGFPKCEALATWVLEEMVQSSGHVCDTCLDLIKPNQRRHEIEAADLIREQGQVSEIKLSNSMQEQIDQAQQILEDTFEKAWAEKEREGYQYGQDALEQVSFGWELARDKVVACAHTFLKLVFSFKNSTYIKELEEIRQVLEAASIPAHGVGLAKRVKQLIEQRDKVEAEAQKLSEALILLRDNHCAPGCSHEGENGTDIYANYDHAIELIEILRLGPVRARQAPPLFARGGAGVLRARRDRAGPLRERLDEQRLQSSLLESVQAKFRKEAIADLPKCSCGLPATRKTTWAIYCDSCAPGKTMQNLFNLSSELVDLPTAKLIRAVTNTKFSSGVNYGPEPQCSRCAVAAQREAEEAVNNPYNLCVNCKHFQSYHYNGTNCTHESDHTFQCSCAKFVLKTT